MFTKLANFFTGYGIEVETTIDDKCMKVVPGGKVTGTVSISGSSESLEKIRGISVSLVTHFKTKVNDQKVWDSSTVAIKEIALDTSGAMRFEIDVPLTTPLSVGEVYTDVKTEVDVPWAFDPDDTDAITIVPDDIQISVIDAMLAQGYTIDVAECEYKAGFGLKQEIDLRAPRSLPHLKEVEIAFLGCSETERDVEITVNKSDGILFEGREIKTTVTISKTDVSYGVSHIASQLENIIGRLSR